MRGISYTSVLAAFAAALLGACSLVTGFDGYHARDEQEGGVDGGRDGGADAGTDGGPLVCDPACGDTGDCVEGVCRCGGGDACASGESCCDGACIDTSSDVEHCDGCGSACPEGPRSTRTCEASSCRLTCESGFADCDAGAPGCETDLSAVSSCGACGNACASGELCGVDASGAFACVDTCDAGLTECSGSCVDVSSSLSHCGGCGMACPSASNTTASCTAGACVYACTGSFVDCNSDLDDPASSDGCEIVPPSRFADADGDGYGVASMTMRFCPGAPSPGYASMSGDCDDTAAGVNPGAAERCNGVDDNCNGTIDEGFGVGTSCSCVAGAAPGVRTCLADGTTTCMYPAEVCGNGVDDDCDGVSNEGCGVDADGDGHSPPADCDDTNPAIHPGATEACDGIDNDCDGFADEDLVTRPVQTVGTYSTTGGSIFPFELSVAWVPSRREGAVLWSSQRSSSSYEIRFSRIDGDGSAIVSDAIAATLSVEPEEKNVAWDGSAWTIIFVESGRLRYVRLANDGSVVTPVQDFPGAAGLTIRQAAIAQGDSDIAVVYHVSSPHEYRGAVMRSGSLTGTVTLHAWAGALFGYRPTVTWVGGSYAAVVQSPPDSGLVYQRFRAGSLDGPSVRLFSSGTAEYPADSAWDPASNRVALEYYTVGAGGSGYLVLVDASSGSMLTSPRDLGNSQSPQVAVAQDGSLLASTYSTLPGLRMRVADAALYPTPPTFMRPPSDSTGLPGTSNRFIAVFTSGGSGRNETQVLTCP